MTYVVDSTNLARLRAASHSSPISDLLAWPLRIVATALVNQASFAYPLAHFTVDNTSAGWGDIRVGQMARVTSGSNVVTTGIVRKAATSNTLYISAMGRGDPGTAQSIHRDLADNQTVTVYDYLPIWTLFSRISGGIFYKRHDEAYTDQGTSPAPVCNIGAWRHARSVSGVAQFAFTAAAAFAWAGKTITNYLWTLPSGGTLISGTLISVACTIELPEGFHLIHCLVTDSGGKTRSATRPIWVTAWDDSASAPISHQRAVKQGSDRQDLTGRGVSFEISGDHDILQSVIYDGGAVMTVDRATHGSNVLDDGVYINQYVGFGSVTSRRGNLEVTTLSYETKSLVGTLADVPNSPQAIIETASPGNWTEVSQGLADPNFVAWYLLEYHCPNALTLFDFNKLPDATPPRKKRWGINAATLGGQLEEVAKIAAGANIGSASDGSIFFHRNPSVEGDSYRAAMETRITLSVGGGDTLGDVEYPVNYRPTVGQLKLSGFTVDSGTDETDAFVVIAHDVTQGQGAGKQEEPAIVVTSLTDLRERVGRLIAIYNNPTPEITLLLNRNMDIFDPARHYGTWVSLVVPARYDPRGEGLTIRCSVKAVEREWRDREGGAANKHIRVTLVPETDGKPGVDITPVRGAGENVPNDPDIIPPDDDWLNVAWAADDQGGLGGTANWRDASPRWRSIKGSITGTVTDMALDWHSPLPRSGWRFGELGAWCVSVNGTALKVWYSDDILPRGVGWTESASITMTDSTVLTSARIVASEKTDGIVWAFWRTRTGSWFIRTSNGGGTWTAATLIGLSFSDSTNDDAPLGACIEGDYVFACGYTGGKYNPYWAAASVGTFTLATTLSVVSGKYADHPIASITRATDEVVYMSRDANAVSVTQTYAATGSTAATLESFTFDPFGAFAWPFGHGAAAPTIFGVDVSYAVDTYLCSMELRYALGDQAWHVTSLAATFELQDWNNNSGVGQGMSYTVDLLDADDNVLHTHSDSFGYLRPNSNVLYSEDDSFSDTGLDLDDVRYILITCTMTADKTDIDQQIFGGLSSFAVTVDGSLILRNEYRVESYISSTLRDYNIITPAADYIARRPYAVAADSQSLVMSALLSNGSTTKLYESDDGGETLTLVDANVPYEGLLRGGDRLIAWGDEVMGSSDDGGETWDNKIGNWAAAVGTVGRFLRVMAAL